MMTTATAAAAVVALEESTMAAIMTSTILSHAPELQEEISVLEELDDNLGGCNPWAGIERQDELKSRESSRNASLDTEDITHDNVVGAAAAAAAAAVVDINHDSTSTSKSPSSARATAKARRRRRSLKLELQQTDEEIEAVGKTRLRIAMEMLGCPEGYKEAMRFVTRKGGDAESGERKEGREGEGEREKEREGKTGKEREREKGRK